MNTTTQTTDRILSYFLGYELDVAALPLPARVPSLADVARYEAMAVEAASRFIQVSQTTGTVRPGKAAA